MTWTGEIENIFEECDIDDAVSGTGGVERRWEYFGERCPLVRPTLVPRSCLRCAGDKVSKCRSYCTQVGTKRQGKWKATEGIVLSYHRKFKHA
jgi:hypothetical protein